jgi:hypothetical protein
LLVKPVKRSTTILHIVILPFLSSVANGLTFNLANCNASLQNETGTVAGRVVNVSGSLAYTYDARIRVCGFGVDGSNFTTIVQQMTL